MSVDNNMPFQKQLLFSAFDIQLNCEPVKLKGMDSKVLDPD